MNEKMRFFAPPNWLLLLLLLMIGFFGPGCGGETTSNNDTTANADLSDVDTGLDALEMKPKDSITLEKDFSIPPIDVSIDQPTPDATGPSAGATALGLAERLSKASNPNAESCGWVNTVADEIVTQLNAANAAVSGFSQKFKDKLPPWVDVFSKFNAVLYGSVLRSYTYYDTDGQINENELRMLVVGLGVHAHAALVPKDARVALLNVVLLLSEKSQTAEVKKLGAGLVRNMAYLFSNLQLCSPK